jgi:hypothetical protein
MKIDDISTPWGGKGDVIQIFREKMASHLSLASVKELDDLEEAFRSYIVSYESIGEIEVLISHCLAFMTRSRAIIRQIEGRTLGGAAGRAYVEGRRQLLLRRGMGSSSGVL